VSWTGRLATFVALLAIGLTWSLGTARYGGPDEPAHILRAASVARGELVGELAPTLAGGYRFVTVDAALTTGDPSCYRHDAAQPATCAVAEAGITGDRRAATSAATYPPYYYALVGLPVRLFGDPAETLWYRGVAAAWCALVLTIVAARARAIAGRRAIVVLAALAPAAWFLVGVVNPNSIEIALALLAWVGVARFGGTRNDALWIGVPIGIAVLFRPVAVVDWVVIAAVTVVRFGWRRRPLALHGPTIAAIVATGLWSTWSNIDLGDARTASDAGFLRALRLSFDGTSDTVREMAGSLGWLEFSAPNIAQLLWWLVVIAAAAAARRSALLIVAAVLATPLVFEVAVRGSVGFIWQGRYSIAVAIGMVALTLPRAAAHGRIAVAALMTAAAAEVITLWTALRRYSVGVNGSWWLHDAAWHPPVSPWLLVAVNAAALGSLALGHLATHDVERRAGAEPLDLLRAERVDALEVEH
jgi:hypothetical protein